MRTVDLLVPGALVPSDFAPELLRGLVLPHLTLLAAHGLPAPVAPCPAQGFLSPWQAWLLKASEQTNFAEAWASALGFDNACGHRRWLAEPVHFEIARDHLVLTEPVHLAVTLDEATALAEIARPLLAEAGWGLTVASATHWLLEREDALALTGPSRELAIGQNVAQWMPVGTPATELAWRRLSNDIQMHWFEHPINVVREVRGALPINALWLSGNGGDAAGGTEYEEVTSSIPYAAVAARANPVGATLETVDALLPLMRAQDWSGWRNQVQALDVRVGERIAHLRARRLDVLNLVLAGEEGVRTVTLPRADLWKFWRRGSAAELFAT